MIWAFKRLLCFAVGHFIQAEVELNNRIRVASFRCMRCGKLMPFTMGEK